MGIGIVKENSMTIYEIPLRSMNDRHWNDNSWIVEHLHQLAKTIEENNFDIYSIGLEMNHQYNAPTLVIKGQERKDEKEKFILLNDFTKIHINEFYGLSDKEKWNIVDSAMNVKWCCYDCGYPTEIPKHATKEEKVIFCKHCSTILTSITNPTYSIADPFNWNIEIDDEIK